MDIEQARFNMIEQQVRPWDVLDQRVLDLMLAVPREQFVPLSYNKLAFADTEIPLGHGQRMLPPRMDGRILQALDIQPTDSVLEIGTGSGYLTALLAKSAHHVWSLDTIAGFSKQADAKLAALNIENVTLETSDAFGDHSSKAMYDVIAITGALPALYDALLHKLNVGGRLFAVIGKAPVMEAQLVTRLSQQEWRTEALFETCIPELETLPADKQDTFVF